MGPHRVILARPGDHLASTSALGISVAAADWNDYGDEVMVALAVSQGWVSTPQWPALCVRLWVEVVRPC
jgi:hypothetical protein